MFMNYSVLDVSRYTSNGLGKYFLGELLLGSTRKKTSGRDDMQTPTNMYKHLPWIQWPILH